jgi:hypothetical protein
MHKIAKIAIVTNLILALLFIGFNYIVWDDAQSTSHLVQLVTFSPFLIFIQPLGGLENGMIVPISMAKVPMFSFPFWIFFVAIAVNLYFMYKLSEKQPLAKN